MDAQLSWLVADANQIDRIAAILDLLRQDENVCFEDIAAEGIVTPEGKCFLFQAGEHSNEIFVVENIQSAISAVTTVYFFTNNECVMFSSAELWQVGHLAWRAWHSAERGRYDLHTEGELPASFENIRATRIAEQDTRGGEDADVDVIMEIPLDLAKEQTGYDGGIDYPEGVDFYLVRKPKPRQSFIERLFGTRREFR